MPATAPSVAAGILSYDRHGIKCQNIYTMKKPAYLQEGYSWLIHFDTAQNIVWGAMSILTFFYTDYAGIDPVMVG